MSETDDAATIPMREPSEAQVWAAAEAIAGRRYGRDRVDTDNPQDFKDAGVALRAAGFHRDSSSIRQDALDEVEDYLVRKDCFTERTLNLIDELRKVEA